jgi:hypothetical protein
MTQSIVVDPTSSILLFVAYVVAALILWQLYRAFRPKRKRRQPYRDYGEFRANDVGGPPDGTSGHHYGSFGDHGGGDGGSGGGHH